MFFQETGEGQEGGAHYLPCHVQGVGDDEGEGGVAGQPHMALVAYRFCDQREPVGSQENFHAGKRQLD